MSISGALSNAVSGLIAASRSAEIVSTNIANAMTEGYGHRSVTLSSRSAAGSGGVNVDGIHRRSDPILLADRRQAAGQDSGAQRLLEFLQTVESNIGIPGEIGSLTSRFADFEASLVSAASMPNAQERLQAVSRSALDLVRTFNDISHGIQGTRKQADQNIGSLVDGLNANLKKVEKLNQEISQATIKRQDPSPLLDQRQRILDEIATVVPIRLMSRDNGQIGVYSSGGVPLVDGKAAQLSFRVSNEITAHQTLGNGTLTGLTVNGQTVDTSETGSIGGGLLQTEFDIRDRLAVTLQTDLDAMARDLVARFQDSTMDPSLAPGAPGVFTDNGAAFSGVDATGLSGRLTVNALVDANQTADLWRLRDGLGAAAPSAESNATLLLEMKGRLTASASLVDATKLGGAHTSHGFAVQLSSVVGGMKSATEDDVTFASARLGALREQELAQGVDTDQEMQRLLLVEQTYAANARVIQVVDELMQTLLRL